MASSLRARLKAVKQSSESSRAPARAGGLACYAESRRVPDSLYSPSPEALRRIGWNGRTFDIEKCLFLDTETTGLSGGAGTIAFLVGAGYVRRGVMTVEQFFMRDYSDEADLLYHVKALMEQSSCVVTFNGRTFDMPLLATRFTMNRLRDYPDLFDLDLLMPARRAWKLRLESCKLSNIEEKILGIRRENDLPGSEVPARYFEFLKNGDMSLVDDIIRHNRQDIFTLALLMDRLIDIYGAPETIRDRTDQYSMGKALEKLGESARARDMYRLSAAPRRAVSISELRSEKYAGEANMRLTRLSLRSGDIDSAVSACEQMISRKQMGIAPYIELAKIYEHRLKDPLKAMEYSIKALVICEKDEQESINKRISRLEQKISRAAQRKE